MPLAVVGVLASGCKDPNTTSYDPIGVAAVDVNLDLVPHDQVTSCVESTKFGAFVGDAAALDRWNSAGQSDDDLAEVCTQIWRADPSKLEKIHSEWMAAQAMLGEAP